MILVGRVVRPQGNRGEVVVAPETDFADERFAPGAVVHVDRDGQPGTLTVRESRQAGGRWVVGFVESTSIDDAESLRGLDLMVPADALKPLGPDRYYVHDLIGCRVVTDKGVAVGIVARVDFAGGPLLAVETPRGEVWVPLAAEICHRVDVEARTITIAPPEGLLDVNG